MSASSLSLLGMGSNQALRVIVQDLTKPGVSVGDLAISKPVVETGNEMSVRVGVAGSAYERGDFPYFGAVTVNYKRLDLQDTFGPLGLAFDIPFPCVTSQIIDQLAEALGIVFEEDDYVQELIETNADEITYVLKASVKSPRWMGQVNVQLYRTG